MGFAFRIFIRLNLFIASHILLKSNFMRNVFIAILVVGVATALVIYNIIGNDIELPEGEE
jgi:hypothetical protein